MKFVCVYTGLFQMMYSGFLITLAISHFTSTRTSATVKVKQLHVVVISWQALSTLKIAANKFRKTEVAGMHTDDENH